MVTRQKIMQITSQKTVQCLGGYAKLAKIGFHAAQKIRKK